MTYMADITKQLLKLSDFAETKNPDKTHNIGRMLGLAYFWTKVEAYAKGKKEEAWSDLEKMEITDLDAFKYYDPGDYAITDSPHFVSTAKVSNPIKRFDENYLAKKLNESKYKVPLPVAKEMISEAKRPSNPSVTKTIVER